MANVGRRRIRPQNGKYKLDDPRDTDLEGISDQEYDVFTDDEKLDAARKAFPGYTWFASYTITDKQGDIVREVPEYSIYFNPPDASDFLVYYYLDQAANPVSHKIEERNGKKRVRVKLRLGDPPMGTVP